MNSEFFIMTKVGQTAWLLVSKSWICASDICLFTKYHYIKRNFFFVKTQNNAKIFLRIS